MPIIPARDAHLLVQDHEIGDVKLKFTSQRGGRLVPQVQDQHTELSAPVADVVEAQD